MKKNMLIKTGYGLAVGFVNGFFGSGGGIAAVLFLRKLGLDEKKAHATSVLLILPLCAVSAVFYFLGGGAALSWDTLYIAAGAGAGAVVGAKALRKLTAPAVENIFSVMMVASGLWMLFK